MYVIIILFINLCLCVSSYMSLCIQVILIEPTSVEVSSEQRDLRLQLRTMSMDALRLAEDSEDNSYYGVVYTPEILRLMLLHTRTTMGSCVLPTRHMFVYSCANALRGSWEPLSAACGAPLLYCRSVRSQKMEGRARKSTSTIRTLILWASTYLPCFSRSAEC